MKADIFEKVFKNKTVFVNNLQELDNFNNLQELDN